MSSLQLRRAKRIDSIELNLEVTYLSNIYFPHSKLYFKKVSSVQNWVREELSRRSSFTYYIRCGVVLRWQRRCSSKTCIYAVNSKMTVPVGLGFAQCRQLSCVLDWFLNAGRSQSRCMWEINTSNIRIHKSDWINSPSNRWVFIQYCQRNTSGVPLMKLNLASYVRNDFKSKLAYL